MTDFQSCQCEHATHTERDERGRAEVMSPNGNPGHPYGIKFNPVFLRQVSTDYGTFRVCVDCSKDCLHPENLP